MSFNKHLIKSLGYLSAARKVYTAFLVLALFLAFSSQSILVSQCTITPLVDATSLPSCAEPGEVFSTTLAYDYQGDLPASIDTIIVTDASTPGFEILSYSPSEIKEGRNELDVSVVYNGSCDGANLFVCDVIGGGGAADCSTLISAPIECCEKEEEGGQACNFTLITDLANLPKCATPGVIFTTVLAYNYEGEIPASIDTIVVLDESAPGFEILSYSPTDINQGRNEIEVSVRYDGDCNESNLFVCDVVGAGGAADCSTVVSSTISCCDSPCETVGGVLSGGPFEFCVGDGEADYVSGVEVSGNSGSTQQWVVTGPDTEILGLPSRPEDVNFEGAGLGECFIYHVSYEDIKGLEVGKYATDLTGCFSFSKGIPINRIDCDAEPCMITPQIDKSNIPSCVEPGMVTTITIAYDYQGELPANIDSIVVWDPAKTAYSIVNYGPKEITSGANELNVDIIYDGSGDCETDLSFVIDIVGGGAAFGCNPAVDLTLPCCVDEPCVFTPITELSSLPTCAVPGEVFTTTLVYDYQGNLPAGIDTIIVTDASDDGFRILSYSPTEIQRGRNEMEVSVVYDGDCDESNLFVCDVIGYGGAADCTTTVSSPIPCCEKSECVITPLTDLSTLPTCAVPGEVFTTTLAYDYQGDLPAGIDTIIVTDASDDGFRILSYSPTEIQRGRNEMEVSVVYDGDCNESNLFVCDVIGYGGAADCTTTVSSPIPCCESEGSECVITPITDLSSLPTCAVPGEVFTTTLAYDYQGDLPAGIDTIIVTDASDDGFEILSYSPTEIQRGRNELEVSVVYDGDCSDSNLFVCDIIGSGGAADCTTTVSSPIQCCESEDCGEEDSDEDGVFNDCDNCPTVANEDQEDANGNGIGDACEEACAIEPIIEGLEIPDCLKPGEVFTTTLAYEYTGSLPASIDTIILRDESTPGFEIISYDPKEIQAGRNEMEVSVVFDGDCSDSNVFVCDILGAGGAEACSFTISSGIKCCESNFIDIETFPNPTAGVVFVKAEERSNYMVEVFDNNGEKIMASYKEDKNFFILNTDELHNGTYFMVVTDMETGKTGTSKVAIFK